MTTTYRGADLYPDNVPLPLDTEGATADSFNDAIKAIADRTNFILRRMASMSPPFNAGTLSSTDGQSVLVGLPSAGPVPGGTMSGVTVFGAAPHFVKGHPTEATVLTASFLEGRPGRFAGSKHYYVYCVHHEVESNLWEISELEPDWDGFKAGGFTTHRYMGAFRTDAAARIIPFRRCRGQVLYHRQLRVLSQGNEVWRKLVPLDAYLPRRAQEAILSVRVEAEPSGAGSVQFGPAGFDPSVDGYQLPAPAGSSESAVFIVPATSERRIEYLVNSNTARATFDVLGYLE